LRALDAAASGIVPDLAPDGPIAMHAALALAEHWRLAILGAWPAIARLYLHDHYRPHPGLGDRGAAQRRLDLENRLRDCVRALGDGDP
jgi:hypothetical protein